jgi:hypothetical protein
MDDMIDSMSGDAILGRRLMAFAEARLTPEPATSARLRARVLAVAHRHADLARGDAGLTVLSWPSGSTLALPYSAQAHESMRAARRPGTRRHRRIAGAVVAASLGVALLTGGALAARPGGPLYEARLWSETLTLPADPSARAVAELDRLEQRLREIVDASAARDTVGVTAALAAYESIVSEASAAAILADDEVASAIIATGVGRNLAVLEALIDRVPSEASTAISQALDAAIARSGAALDQIGASDPNDPGGAGAGQPAGGPAAEPTAKPTEKPTAKPKPTPVPTPALTAKPTPAHQDGGGGSKPSTPPKAPQGRGLPNQEP